MGAQERSSNWVLYCFAVTSFLTVLMAVGNATETDCSKNAKGRRLEYVQMCEDGNVTGLNIVIDTFSSSKYGVGLCSCDVTLERESNVLLDILDGLQPSNLSCGSKIEFTNGDKNNTFECSIFQSNVENLETGILTWTLYQNDGSSKYCILLRFYEEEASVTCYKPPRSVTPYSTTSQQSADDVATTRDTTGSTSDVTVITSFINSTQNTAFENITPNINERETTSISTEASGQDDREKVSIIPNKEILIIGGALGSGVCLIIALLVGIVCFRFHQKKKRDREQQKHISGVEQNELYMSGKEIQVANTQHSPNSASENVLDIRTEREQHENNIQLGPTIDQPNAIYSVVNKPKQKSTMESSASANVNKDGLHYADLADFSVTDSSKVMHMSDNDMSVLYSEIVKT